MSGGRMMHAHSLPITGKQRKAETDSGKHRVLFSAPDTDRLECCYVEV